MGIGSGHPGLQSGSREWESGLGTRDYRAGVGSGSREWESGVGSGSRESGVGSRESGVGSRESGVGVGSGSRESGVGSRESGLSRDRLWGEKWVVSQKKSVSRKSLRAMGGGGLPNPTERIVWGVGSSEGARRGLSRDSQEWRGRTSCSVPTGADCDTAASAPSTGAIESSCE